MKWWDQYAKEVLGKFAGELWSASAQSRRLYATQFVKTKAGDGICREPDTINTGKNSGFQALSLAHLWGAARVLLLGYDMQRAGSKTHWHPDHPRDMGNGGNFYDWRERMARLAADLKTQGVEVVNCSRKTALSCFPCSTIDRELRVAN